MKESLKQGIALFSVRDRVKLYFILACRRLRVKMLTEFDRLFNECNEYVNLIEKGVILYPEDSVLIRADLYINEKKVKVFIRRNSSDIKVLESVLLHGEYKIAAEELMKSSPGRKNIIDAGGNIGLTTIFLNCYNSNCFFIVIEPDEKNVSVLKKNLNANNIRDVVVLERALWTADEDLAINDSFRDGKEWSLTVEVLNQNNASEGLSLIKGITIQSICEKENIKKIDLLKIDIEGAERFLFRDQEFINLLERLIVNLVIEIHDEFKIRDLINQTMKQIGFTAQESSDVTFYSKNIAYHMFQN